LDDRTNDEDLPIWLCVDPSRDERETRKDNGQIGAPMENNPAIPQLIGSRRLLTTISHGIPSSQQRCRNTALNRKSPDSENPFSHARRDARRADGKQRLRRRAPPIIHDVDQLRARCATSRLFQRLAAPGTSWMVRRPFDGGSPRGNQYFHASKGWAPSTRSTSLKASLGTMVCSLRPLSVRLVGIP